MDPAAAAELISSLTTTVAPDMVSVQLPLWMEMLATVVGSVCGALIARELKLDYIGTVALALVTGLGGGLLRDMILQVHNVYMIDQPLAIPASLIAGTVTFLFPVVIAHQDKLINLLDIIVVGIFAATGADKAQVYGFQDSVCIMMGFLTAVGGGMLRDVFVGRTPAIFQRSNFYAIAAIGGSAAYLLLSEAAHLEKTVCVVGSVLVTLALRFLSLKFNIQSPSDVDLGPVVARPFKKVGSVLTAHDAGNDDQVYALIRAKRRQVEAEIAARRSADKQRKLSDKLNRARRRR